MWTSAIIKVEVAADRSTRLADAVVGSQIDAQNLSRETRTYGPAVRRKRIRRSGGCTVLHQCIRPLIGAWCSGPPWISARVRSHYRLGLNRAIRVSRVRMRREDRSSCIVTVLLQLAAQVVSANAGFHADKARWRVGKPCFKLPPGPLLAQHDRAAFIETDEVKRVLADIDADRGNGRAGLAGHGSALFVAPFQHHLLVGQEHGRTIPLPVSAHIRTGLCARAKIPLGNSLARPETGTAFLVGCRRGVGRN
jgi:hypothetical protein